MKNYTKFNDNTKCTFSVGTLKKSTYPKKKELKYICRANKMKHTFNMHLMTKSVVFVCFSLLYIAP